MWPWNTAVLGIRQKTTPVCQSTHKSSRQRPPEAQRECKAAAWGAREFLGSYDVKKDEGYNSEGQGQAAKT